MADELPPVIAKFVADATEIAAPVQAAVDEAKASMAELAEGADQAAASVDTADAEITASFEEMAGSATQSAAEIRAAYAEMGVGAGADSGIEAGVEAEAAAYQDATDQILASMQEQLAGSQALAAEIAASSDADAAAVTAGSDEMVAANERAAASTEEVGTAMDATGASLTATLTPWALAGAAAVAGIALVVKAGADLQTTVTRLATSGGELQSNLASDTTAIEALAGQVGLSADALATGMYTVTSAGYQGADAIKVLTGAAQGAVTENADLGTVVNAVTDLLNDYHLSAGNATQVTSAMITAVSLGKTTFQDLSAAMSIVSPTAANLHISIQELLGDLSEATSHGISADEAAQQLANTFRSLSNPTSTVTAELGQLGISSISLSQTLGKTGVSGALEEIQQAILTKMGPAGTVLLNSFNQSQVAANNAKTALAGLGTAAQKVAEQYASGQMAGGFAAWSAALKGLSGPQANLLNQWKALQDSSNGFSNALKTGGGDVQSYTQALAKATGNASTLQTALVLTGQNFNTTSGDITKIKSALDGSSTSVSGFAQQQQTLNAKLNDAKAGFGALVDAIGEKLLPIITKMVSVFATVADWLSKHQQVATALAYVIGGVLVVAVAALAIGMAFLAVMIAPIVLVAQQLIEHWSGIANFFKSIWDGISSQFEGGVNAVKDVVKWFEGLPDEIGGFFDKLPSVLGKAASDAGTALLDGVKTAGTDTLNFLKNFPAESGHALGELAGTLARLAVNGAKAFYTGITTQFKDALTFFQNLPKEILSFLENATTWLDNTGHNVITGFVNGIVAEAVTFWNWLIALPGNILHWLGDTGTWLGNAGLNIVKGLWNGIQSGASWLLNQVKSFASNVISGFESAFGIHSPSTITYQHGLYLVQGYANAIRDNAGLMVSAATTAASKTLGAFSGKGTITATLGNPLPGGLGGTAGSLAGGAAGGQPIQVVIQMSSHEAQEFLQGETLRYNLRNSGNGLSVA